MLDKSQREKKLSVFFLFIMFCLTVSLDFHKYSVLCTIKYQEGLELSASATKGKWTPEEEWGVVSGGMHTWTEPAHHC